MNIGIILGGNKLNLGVYYKLKKIGMDKVIIIDWNENPYLKGDLHLKIDVKNSKETINKLKELNILESIKVVYTSIDLATKTAKNIHDLLGLKTPSLNSLENTLSKRKMQKIWSEKGLSNKKVFTENTDMKEILDFNKENRIIIKPDQSSSSRGISIIEKKSKMNYIINAIEKAKKESFNEKFIIEEFIEGQEYTVEMLGDNYGNVEIFGISKKYHTRNNTKNRIATKLHYNSQDLKINNYFINTVINLYKSLGLKNSFGHLEIIEKKNGDIVPIEIGARSSGFIASDLLDVFNYKSYLKEYINVLNNKSVFNGYSKKKDISSMFYFYDFPNKICKKIDNIKNYLNVNIKSLYSNTDSMILGKKFEVINNDNERHGFEILYGKKNILTIEHIESAEKNLIKNVIGGN